MPSSGAEEKTEQATPKKRRDERKKGNVFSSKDLVAALSILLFFLVLNLFSEIMYGAIYESMRFWISSSDDIAVITKETTNQMLLAGFKTVLTITLPIFAVSIIAPIIFTGIQTRFIFSKDAMMPKFSRLNPIEGFKKLFALRGIVELIKNLIKLAIIIAIIYNFFTDNFAQILTMYDVDPVGAILFLGSSVISVVISISVVFLFIGIADVFYQWWEFEKNIKMTKQEVKEEYKQMEGDPHIKGAIKQRQRQMAQKRMMADVPTADVVVRNPTHFAVAIKYTPGEHHAPIVVAKGMDYIALKIIDIAIENDVTLQENKPLARALYDTVDVGREIPEEFFQPVAEILAFVYDLKQKKIIKK